MNSKEPTDQINQWFITSTNWQKDLFCEILNHDLSDDEIEKCLNDYLNGNIRERDLPTVSLGILSPDSIEEICSLSKVNNVGAIKNNSKIEFEAGKSITIVYGKNGSGKSTYINLLKNMCDSRNKKNVISNVYNEPTEPSASIQYIKSGNHTFEWAPNKKCDDLKNIEIFDSDFLNVYLDSNGASVLYEPNILFVLTKMAQLYAKFDDFLSKELTKLTIKQIITDEVKKSMYYEKYILIKSFEDIDCFKQSIEWSDNDQKRIEEIQQLLSTKDTTAEIDKLNRSCESLASCKQTFQKYYSLCDNDIRNKITHIKQNIIKSKEAVFQAEHQFEDMEIPGIGNEIWKTMWSAAREYSEKFAYPDHSFPNVDDDSICILCHQTLSSDSKKLLLKFDEYVKSKIELTLKNNIDIFNEEIEKLKMDDWTSIKLKLVTNNIDAVLISKVKLFYDALDARYSELKNDKPEKQTKLFSIVFFNNWIDGNIDEMRMKITQYEKLSQERHALEKELIDLNGKKWFFDNDALITDCTKEINIKILRKETNTEKISKLKTRLSAQLITSKYEEIFKNELKSICAQSIKVDIKGGSNRAIYAHKLTLHGAKSNESVNEIFSEGECKAVSFAAFVAELEYSGSNAPFIFDDPTNSLDNDYEENIARRIIELSNERQVIIFTHRLPIITYLVEKKAGQNIRLLQLSSDEVGTIDHYSGLMLGSVKEQIDFMKTNANRLSDVSTDQYENTKNSLCTAIRKLIEKTIEDILFDGIVVRHRREIKTMKLNRMQAFKPEDAVLLDKLMSKYSESEHPQTDEAPFRGFSKETILVDLTELNDWVSDYNKRKEKYEKAAKAAISKYVPD